MFRMIRNNMKKIFVVTILLIVPPFVIWGVGSIDKDEGNKTAGRVYGKKISALTYLQSRDACMLNLYLLYGPNFRDLLPMVDLNRQAWDRIMLLAKASREGIVISDAEVAAQIEKLFRKGDAYDRGKYDAFLQQAGLPALVFEQRIRDTLTIGRLTRIVTDTALVTRDELEEAFVTKGEKAKAQVALFSPRTYAQKIPPDESKEREYFQKHRQEFRVSDQVKVRYVLFSPDNFQKGIKVKEEEIRDYYESHQTHWTDPKTEKVQPLEKVKEKIREDILRQRSSDAAFERATDLSMALFDQPNLEKAAKEARLLLLNTEFFSSEDAKSPLDSREFVGAAFATDVGKNSPVIKTPHGFAILSPVEKRPGHVPAFEQIKNLVEEKVRAQEAQRQMLAQASKIRDEVVTALKAGRGSFPELIKSLGLEIHATGTFSRDTALDNVPDPDRFKEACFRTPAGEITPLLSHADGALFAYVQERQPGTLDNFDKEKESLRAQLLARKKENILTTWYDVLRRESRLEDRAGGLR